MKFKFTIISALAAGIVSLFSALQANGSPPDLLQVGYLPVVSKYAPGTIYGFMFENELPAPGLTVTLEFCQNYEYNLRWSALFCSDIQEFAATTDDAGMYRFLDMPTLEVVTVTFGSEIYTRTQTYQAVWNNVDNNPQRLRWWRTQLLDEYIVGTTVLIGQSEVSDVELLAPADNAVLSGPSAMFQWTPRVAAPSDTYAVCESPTSMWPYWALCYEAGPQDWLVRYLGSGQDFTWNVLARDPTGGSGESFSTYTFYLSP